MRHKLKNLNLNLITFKLNLKIIKLKIEINNKKIAFLGNYPKGRQIDSHFGLCVFKKQPQFQKI